LPPERYTVIKKPGADRCYGLTLRAGFGGDDGAMFEYSSKNPLAADGTMFEYSSKNPLTTGGKAI
jgi:hypothetical protein